VITATPLPSSTSNSLEEYYEAIRTTFDAKFITSDTQISLTGTAAHNTLEARKAYCMNGYDILYPQDMVREERQIKTATDQWVVIQCLPNRGILGGYTLLANHDGSITWRISYETLQLPYEREYLWGHRADQAGKYLYLVPGNLSSPSGGYLINYIFGWGYGLYRIDLQTGQLQEVLGEVKGGYYVDLSLSSDARYVAWSSTTESNMAYIQDLEKKEVTKVELGESYKIVGAFNWSPDNRTLVFAASLHELEEGKSGISLFTLDTKDMQPRLLFYDDQRNLVPWFNSNTSEMWLNTDTMRVASYSYETDYISEEWELNIRTGDLIQLPQPTSTLKVE
jgi:hypothetical protein